MSNLGVVSSLALLTILYGEGPLLRVRHGLKQGGPLVLQALLHHMWGVRAGFSVLPGVSTFLSLSPLTGVWFSPSPKWCFSHYFPLMLLFQISLPTCHILCCKKTLKTCRINDLMGSLWFFLFDDGFSSWDRIEIDLTVRNKHFSVSCLAWECTASFFMALLRQDCHA